MNRRTLLALAAVPLAAAFLEACGGSGGTGPFSPKASGPTEAKSDLRRSATVGDDDAPAAAALATFGPALLARLVAADPDANVVCSPASIAVALTMASAGANGTTLAEMDEVLGIDDPATIHRAFNALTAAYARRTRHDDGSSLELELTNSLWGQRGLEFQQPFLDLLAGEYGAGLSLVDYTGDPEGSRRTINAWVDEATRQRIPELLAKGTITPDSRLTLVNAIYLKASWDLPFDAGYTGGDDFTTASGETVSVRMMHQTNRFGYADTAEYTAVELPYAFDDLSMLVIVSKGDAVPDLDAVRASLESTKVRLGLPKFDFATAVSLADVLQQMGMRRAFGDDPDFSAMTTSDELHISAVIHQAKITVDESGTEAAAATAVGMAAGAAPGAVEEIVAFTIDRPFVFAIHDTPTNTDLFLGKVTNPAA